MSKKKPYNFRVDENDLEKLEKISEKENDTGVSELIRIFIKVGIKELGNKRLAKYLVSKGVG